MRSTHTVTVPSVPHGCFDLQVTVNQGEGHLPVLLKEVFISKLMITQ
jgi:hypothetical protein